MGSAFAIDVEDRQYIVTAKHVVSGFVDGLLEIFHENMWKHLHCDLVGHGVGEIDVSVLAPQMQVAPTYPLPPTSAGMALGQTTYFLGFPYDHRTEIEGDLTARFPLPLVKAGVLSSMGFDRSGKTILLDGHNNPGFSGGPIVFIPNGNHPASGIEFRVAGIVSGYPSYLEPVVDSDRKETGLFVENNPGIVLGYNISHATDLISKNPIGCSLEAK